MPSVPAEPTASALVVASLGPTAAQRAAAPRHALLLKLAALVRPVYAHQVSARELDRSVALRPDVPLLCQLSASRSADANAASHASPEESAALRTGAAAPSLPEITEFTLDS